MGEQDRIAGALLGMAAGDALGAGYELADPPQDEVAMIGGGLGDFAPGEWTDDTSMALCIGQVAVVGSIDLDVVGERFLVWYRSGPLDVGISTADVLRGGWATLPPSVVPRQGACVATGRERRAAEESRSIGASGADDHCLAAPAP